MTRLSPGQCASLACVLEAAAPKVGNVHRSADYHDMTLQDFLVSAVVVGPVFDDAEGAGVGATVLRAVQIRRQWSRANTNLGIALLLAPLAAAGQELTPAAVARTLETMNGQDAADVYEAIRLAAPGGLGSSDKWDVHDAPPKNLLQAMEAAATRDLIAQQYTQRFRLVFEDISPWLEAAAAKWTLPDAIVNTHVRLMANHPDTLISRKCGVADARHSSLLAKAALDCGEPGDEDYFTALTDMDFWLRSDGNRRNPGATADLIAAALYVLLMQDRLPRPLT